MAAIVSNQLNRLPTGQQSTANSLSVVMAVGASVAVTGTLATTAPIKTPGSGSITIGTTAVQLSTRTANNAVLSWASTNTGIIYIGTSNAVTAATAGFELSTDSRSLPVECNNVSEYWAIASAASQTLRWIAS